MSSAAVRPAAAVEGAGSATVEAAATAIAATAAAKPAAAVAAIEAAAKAAAATLVIVATATVTTVSAAAIIRTATVAVSTAVITMSVAVEPGAGADEDAAGEPIRPVEAIGGTGVGIIIVVAVSADWRGPVIGRGSNSNAESDALGLRVRNAEETNAETNTEQTEKP